MWQLSSASPGHCSGLESWRQGETASGLEQARILYPDIKILFPIVRRWDNMQQHSGQHLLSAVLEKQYNAGTLSWWMAENTETKVDMISQLPDIKIMS